MATPPHSPRSVLGLLWIKKGVHEPHPVDFLPSRDAVLVRKIGEATALEVRATGIHWAFAPCVAVSKIQKKKRHPN